MLWKKADPRYRRLLSSGQQGDALVIEAREDVLRSGMGEGEGTFGDNRFTGTAGWSVTIRMEYPDGSVEDFERYIESRSWGYMFLEPGTRVPVRYDPTDRSKLEVDVPALEARRNDANAELTELKQVSDQGGSGNPKADLIRLSINKAKRKGDAAEVQRLTAMLADLEHGTSEPTRQ